jgi:PAS domain-containing protein
VACRGGDFDNAYWSTAEAIAVWERCKVSGEPYVYEYRLRGADGVYRWFLSRKTATRGAGGIEQWIGICTNIDDRKRRG